MAECYFQQWINAAVLNLPIYLAMTHCALKQLLNEESYTMMGCIKDLSNYLLKIATALSRPIAHVLLVNEKNFEKIKQCCIWKIGRLQSREKTCPPFFHNIFLFPTTLHILWRMVRRTKRL